MSACQLTFLLVLFESNSLLTCCQGYEDQKGATQPCRRASQKVHMEKASGTKENH